jgi:hypothetical protein
MDHPVSLAALYDAEPCELAKVVFDSDPYPLPVEDAQEIGRQDGLANPPQGFDDLHAHGVKNTAFQSVPEVVARLPIAHWHSRSSVGSPSWPVTFVARIIADWLSIEARCAHGGLVCSSQDRFLP